MWLKLKHPKPKISTAKEKKVAAVEIKVENTKEKKKTEETDLFLLTSMIHYTLHPFETFSGLPMMI